MDQKKCQNISWLRMLCCLEQINTFCIQKALNGNILCIWTLGNANIIQRKGGEEWKTSSAVRLSPDCSSYQVTMIRAVWAVITLPSESFSPTFFLQLISHALDNLRSDSIHCNLLLSHYWGNSYAKVKHFKQIALPCLRWVANPSWS